MPAADDDSLRWGGEADDPSYLDGVRRQLPESRAALPQTSANNSSAQSDSGDRDGSAGAAAATPVTPGTTARDASAPRIGSALLVSYGVLAGITIFSIFGWVLAFQRETFAPANPFLAAMYDLGHILAITAPAVWFTTVLLLTGDRRAIARLGWLLLGTFLLAPWPFILSGAMR